MSHRSLNQDSSGVWQPLSVILTSIDANTGSAGTAIYFPSLDTAAEFAITAAGRAILDDITSVAQTETLGLNSTASGSVGCSLIGSPSIGVSTFTTVCSRLNFLSATGRATGGLVTDATSENINIAAGTGLIKATDDDTAEVLNFDWVANPALATTTDSHQHAGVIYNGGAPIVDIRASNNYDLDTEFPLASIINENGTLHILNNPWWVTDGVTNIIERFNADGYIVRDKNVGGLIISVPGTRNLASTAGTLWSNLNEFPLPSLDTFTAKVASHSAVFDVDNGSSKGTITASAGTPYADLSANDYIAITGTSDNDGTYKIESVVGDNVITMNTVISGTDGTEATTVINSTFEYYSYDGVAGTWSDTHNTQYSVTEWNDTSLATLQTINNNKYVNMWVYAEADDKDISMVYGQAQYVSAAAAEAEAPPTLLPLHIQEHSILIGRIIIKQAVDAPVQVDSAFDVTFTAAQAADHGNLSGLSDNDHPQYVLVTDTFSWSTITGATAAAINNGYFCNNAATRVVVTLPAVADVGSIVRISGVGAAGWEVDQNAGQTIYMDALSTTTGITGKLQSTQTRDAVQLVCFVANTDWQDLSSSGNITVV